MAPMLTLITLPDITLCNLCNGLICLACVPELSVLPVFVVDALLLAEPPPHPARAMAMPAMSAGQRVRLIISLSMPAFAAYSLWKRLLAAERLGRIAASGYNARV